MHLSTISCILVLSLACVGCAMSVRILEPKTNSPLKPEEIVLSLSRDADPQTLKVILDDRDITAFFQEAKRGRLVAEPGAYCGGVSAAAESTLSASAEFLPEKPTYPLLSKETQVVRSFRAPSLEATITGVDPSTRTATIAVAVPDLHFDSSVTFSPFDSLLRIGDGLFGQEVTVSVATGTRAVNVSATYDEVKEITSSGLFVTSPCFVRLSLPLTLNP